MSASVDEWIAAETRFAADAMLAAIYATDLVMDRAAFAQRSLRDQDRQRQLRIARLMVGR